MKPLTPRLERCYKEVAVEPKIRKKRVEYKRVIVQVNGDNNLTVVQDLGVVTTAKAQSAKRKLGKTLPNLAVIYWVG